ncbi:uncharacterized protein FOMMEDRAFT_139469 [Fomitiporia mediterranea MF3/22]|uniref:uncharacterized protein n=1 Tax=Fomitiporia mediterranea (strain MF3/22) TaxID=694068 RepID=UPI00044081D3|nr:uncharacterized protein FOMMEDRAFT_139469 [Fomitiporia mediterranea MF3/22]EJD06282.1 hypothetical protein FOMMEDRAFT_139469 [Fomitiporia mediterranea MF3/22]
MCLCHKSDGFHRHPHSKLLQLIGGYQTCYLRSVYLGILDDEAFEYELERYCNLQEVRQQKLVAAVKQHSYDLALQYSARALLVSRGEHY